MLARVKILSAGKKDICQFYLEGKCRFGEDCFNIHPPDVPQQIKKKSSPNKTNLKDKNELVKKSRMKTAQDVINRIKWDSDFEAEHFIVGYTDRFRGLIEEKFNSFTWEDLCTLDWDTLAIPQHRIQYFKYKTEKVWEKETRTDLVFGSTGSKEDILQVMSRIDNLQN